MGLKVSLDEILPTEIDTEEALVESGWMRHQRVYGKRANLAYFERGDYHSAPHKHTAEQLNYVLEGKVWWFVEDEGFLLKPGDFHRVPANAVHWARAEEPPIKMIEAHSPPLGIEEEAVGLFADDETPVPDEVSTNEGASVENWEEKEAEMMERYYEEHPEDR